MWFFAKGFLMELFHLILTAISWSTAHYHHKLRRGQSLWKTTQVIFTEPGFENIEKWGTWMSEEKKPRSWRKQCSLKRKCWQKQQSKPEYSKCWKSILERTLQDLIRVYQLHTVQTLLLFLYQHSIGIYQTASINEALNW